MNNNLWPRTDKQKGDVQQTDVRFTCHQLDEGHCFYSGGLPSELTFDENQFESLWHQHPNEFHEIMMHGRLVKTPRWQQAYGKDYHYTGNVNRALPVPQILQPLHHWCQNTIDARLNGILLNWYDGSLGHYIGAHRDSTTNMLVDAPIVTASFGQSRVFRLRPWKGKGFLDFRADHGTVFIMPYATNQAWTHEVPKAKRFQQRRISVTLRAFQ
jgi:alkylated DNA repair dioxygenase AlkB